MDTMPVGQQTQAQQQVGQFAHHPADYAAMERNAGIQESNRLRVAGDVGRAHMAFFRSYKRQLRILGLGHVGIPGHQYLDDGPGALS
jgi:hypothetical protein